MVTFLITHRFRPSIAVLVRKHGHQPHGKAFSEVIDHIFAGGEIDFECFTFCIGEIGDAAIEHGFGGRDELHYNSVAVRSEEHTSELQSLMRSSYAVFCLKNKKQNNHSTRRQLSKSKT